MIKGKGTSKCETGYFQGIESRMLYYCGKEMKQCTCGNCGTNCGPSGCPCEACGEYYLKENELIEKAIVDNGFGATFKENPLSPEATVKTPANVTISGASDDLINGSYLKYDKKLASSYCVIQEDSIYQHNVNKDYFFFCCKPLATKKKGTKNDKKFKAKAIVVVPTINIAKLENGNFLTQKYTHDVPQQIQCPKKYILEDWKGTFGNSENSSIRAVCTSSQEKRLIQQKAKQVKPPSIDVSLLSKSVEAVAKAASEQSKLTRELTYMLHWLAMMVPTSSTPGKLLFASWSEQLRKIIHNLRRKVSSVNLARSSKYLLKRFYAPTILMRDAGVLTVADVDIVRSMCVSVTSEDIQSAHDRIITKVKSLLRERAPQHRKANTLARETDSKQRAAEIAATAKSISLAHDLQLATIDKKWEKYIGELKVAEDNLVGLDNVKVYVQSLMVDTIGRIGMQEDPSVRHIVISGLTGTGKQTSGEYIGKWRKLLQNTPFFVKGTKKSSTSQASGSQPSYVKKGGYVVLNDRSVGDASGGPLQEGDAAKVIDVGSDKCQIDYNGKQWWYRYTALRAPGDGADCHFCDDIKSLEEMFDMTKEDPTPTYILKMAATPPSPALSKILEEMQTTNNGVVIFSGESNTCDALVRQTAFFRKRSPDVLELPVIGQRELARVSLQQIAMRGYKLSSVSGVIDSEIEGLKFMERIVKQKYGTKAIASRNAYLADDCIDLAISRKNMRVLQQENELLETFSQNSGAASQQFSVSLPFVLTMDDFDVKSTSKEDSEKKIQAAEDRIAAMHNWGSDTTPNTPLHWFASQRRQIAHRKEKGENAEHEGNMWDYNVVIEGGTGAGKLTFATLAVEFLQAYGVIEVKDVVKKGASEVMGGDYDSADDAKKKTDSVFTDTNAVIITQADKISLSTAVANDPRGGAQASAVIGAALVEHSNICPFIALTCDIGACRSVVTAHNELENKFPHFIRLDEPSIDMFVTVAKDYSENEKKLEFSADLNEVICDHVADTYADKGSVPGGMRLAKTMIDSAIRKQRERVARSREKQIKIQENMLIPLDFEIGKELGDPEARAAIYKKIEGLIGMDKAKEWLAEAKAAIDFANATGKLSNLKICRNVILTGNPGTGKTTFARLIHEYFKAHGILSGEFVEKNALELKGEYDGQTAPMVKACFEEARNGTLFLDEAYALAGEGTGTTKSTTSMEAIRTLLTEIENNRSKIVVILAGYEEKMKHLIQQDAGLGRRFPLANRLHLASYNSDQIAQIANYTASSVFGMRFEGGLDEKLSKQIMAKHRRVMENENGGLAVNLVEAAVQLQQKRIVNMVDDNSGELNGLSDKAKKEFMLKMGEELMAADFGLNDNQELGASELEKEKVEKELESLIGMANVKKFFHKMRDTASFVELTGKVDALGGCLHLILTGNPGTGKTTTARLISRYLHAFGILPSNTFKEVNGLALKAPYAGQTSHHVTQIVNDALGGCLFIDEAYSLIAGGGDNYSQEVIRTLLTEVENHRSDLLVIMAGYEGPMEELLDADPGLRSRFSTRLHLTDYDAMEIGRIAEYTATKKNFIFEDGLAEVLGKHIHRVHSKRIAEENGRLAVNLIDRAVEELGVRVVRSHAEGMPMDEIKDIMSVLTVADFGADGNTSDESDTSNGIDSEEARELRRQERVGQPLLCQVITPSSTSPVGGGHLPPLPPNGSGPSGDDGDDNIRSRGARPMRQRPVDDRGPRLRQVEVKVETRVEEVVEEDVEEEVDYNAALKEKLLKVGVCPASYAWRFGSYEGSSCDKCDKTVHNGYRCEGGSHYVCQGCVNMA